MSIWKYRINALNFRCLISKNALFFSRILLVFFCREKCSGHYFNEKVIMKWVEKRRRRKLDEQRTWKSAGRPNKSSSFAVCWRKRKSIYWLSNLRVESWTNAHKSRKMATSLNLCGITVQSMVSFLFCQPSCLAVGGGRLVYIID